MEESSKSNLALPANAPSFPPSDSVREDGALDRASGPRRLLLGAGHRRACESVVVSLAGGVRGRSVRHAGRRHRVAANGSSFRPFKPVGEAGARTDDAPVAPARRADDGGGQAYLLSLEELSSCSGLTPSRSVRERLL